MSELRDRIELCLLLPEGADACDACVARLQSTLVEKRGVTGAHVRTEPGHAPVLCLHYDPGAISLAQLEREARMAGGRLAHQFGHEVFALRAVDGEDAARKIERSLKTVITTGMIMSPWLAVRALNSLQKPMMLTPC